MTHPRLPPRPAAAPAPPPMPPRARVHVEPEPTPAELPRTLVNVVEALANEALERSVRDRSMLAIGERVARGVEALVVEVRALQRPHVPPTPPRATRWPTAAWVAIALSAGVLGAALGRALASPRTQEVSHVHGG